MNDFFSLPGYKEKLLQEIKVHLGDGEYWSECFENLSCQDYSLLRSAFKDLKEREMILVSGRITRLIFCVS